MFLLAVALFIVLATAIGVINLQQRSDASRQAEILVAHIEALANRLKRLEIQAERDRTVTPELDAQADEVRSQIIAALDEAVRLGTNSAASLQMQTGFHNYQIANEELFRLYKQGEQDKAHEWDEEYSDPAYDRLFDETNNASRIYRQQAQNAFRAATFGSIFLVTSAILLIGILFWRFEQAQRATALLATQQETLRKSEERFRSLVRHASDVIAIVDSAGTLHYLSQAVDKVWGYAPQMLVGQSAFEFVSPEDQRTIQDLMAQTLQRSGSIITTELRFQHANGTWRDFEVIANNLLDDPGVQGIVLTYHDITERKRFEHDLTHLAFHDPLSNLPNRALLMDRLALALARAERLHTAIAILSLDLDNFKVVNDSLGHESGDCMLIAIAKRLQTSIRAVDTVARLGGDEFVILLEEITNIADAIRITERIIAKLQEPLHLDDHEIFPTFSIGITLGTPGQDRPEVLLRNADLAMYRAKRAGKAQYAVFDPTMNATAIARLELESDLRHAIERAEFEVYYQPILNLKTGYIREVEALVRWRHPERGLIAPIHFIPVAEETGMILSIGQWVLIEACRQLRSWETTYPAQQPMVISVNLSARQFQSPRLVEDIARILEETETNPACLKLEITESVMMQDAEEAHAILSGLKGLGVQLAIDDFGTGYSSLAYLQRFPVDVLKIDRSFIDRLGHSVEETAIVHAIITLAKTLNLTVTGEGIETEEQLVQLIELGCDLAQGYYIAKPSTSEAVVANFGLVRADILQAVTA